jgi:hypothetical protein
MLSRLVQPSGPGYAFIAEPACPPGGRGRYQRPTEKISQHHPIMAMIVALRQKFDIAEIVIKRIARISAGFLARPVPGRRAG